MTMISESQRWAEDEVTSAGFSLLELLVAMAVFLAISAVSFTLFSQHQQLLTSEQVASGLNIGLRNALSQIQLDVANAGDGLILGVNVPAWPVGITIQNTTPNAILAPYTACNTTPSPPCNPSGSYPPVYSAACFDSMSIILADRSTPPLNPQSATINYLMVNGVAESNWNVVTSSATPPNSVVLYACGGQLNLTTMVCTPNQNTASPIINPATSQAYTPTTWAGQFHTGDQILFVKSCAGGFGGGTPAPNSSGCKFTTATLTANGATAPAGSPPGPNYVMLTFGATQAGGANTVANDPLQMTTTGQGSLLTDTFAPTDFVVRLAPITYYVNASNVDGYGQSDPQLMRKQGTVANPLMDQVIAFKVGAATWSSANSTSSFSYDYENWTYNCQYNLIRSIRVSLIGRTEPNPTNPYRNPFDDGPYQTRGNSLIIDPRNLTMNQD